MPVPDDYPFDLPFENGEGLEDAFRDIPKSPDLEDVDDEFKKMNCYKGNLSLKGNNVQVPMSPAHVTEFKKCRDDIFYFLIKYLINCECHTVLFQSITFNKPQRLFGRD